MKGIKFMFLLFAIVFGGVGVGMFFGFVMPEFKDQEVIKNGTPAIATFNNYASNTTVNGEPYYYISFTYTDADGNLQEWKTASAYTYSEALKFEEEGTLNIKYKNGRAVADPYKKAKFASFAWIFVVAFGGVGVGMGVAFIMAIKRDIFEKKVKIKGLDGVGTYLGKSSNVTVNGAPLFKIHFTFTNQNGESIESKSRSIYKIYEADALAEMGQFGVKYINNKAVINVTHQDMTSSLNAIKQQREDQLRQRQSEFQQMQQRQYDPNYFDSNIK